MVKLVDVLNQVLKEKRIKLITQQNEEILTEKCWAGYVQKGTKIMFGKKYPNCVKK